MNNWRSESGSDQDNTEPTDSHPQTEVYPKQGTPSFGNPPQQQQGNYPTPYNPNQGPNPNLGHSPQPGYNPYLGPSPNLGYGTSAIPTPPSTYNYSSNTGYSSPVPNSYFPGYSPVGAGVAAAKNDNTKLIVAGIAIITTLLLVIFLLIGVFLSTNQQTQNTAAQTSNRPRVPAPTNNSENTLGHPAPVPAPPRDRTNDQSSIGQQTPENESIINNSFPHAISQAIDIDSCEETEFVLNEQYTQLDCAFSSQITPGEVEYVAIVTDPAAVNSLIHDYDFPAFRYIRSAPDHDLHLMSEIYLEEYGYATYAYDLQPNNVAIIYNIFADELTTSNFFVDIGLADRL